MTPAVFKTRIKKSDLNGMLSNKGAFPLDKQFAYQIRYFNYLKNTPQVLKVSCPFIDKISIKGDANITSDVDKAEFQASLEHKLKLRLHLDPSEYIIEDLGLNSAMRRKSRYRYHYKIVFANGRYTANLLFSPFKEGRFLKLEFSLKKFGEEGLLCLAFWFAENVIHSTFYEFISEPDSLGELEIAIDCTGIPFSQFGFRIRDEVDQVWESRGLPQTVYMNAKVGVPTKIKVYNKSKQCLQNAEPSPYPDEKYIVRIEIKVKTKYALTQLHLIKSTHFKNVMIYAFSGHIKSLPAERHWVRLFVQSVLKKGIKSTLRGFPSNQRGAWEKYLKKQKLDFLSPFGDFHFWRSTWMRTLKGYEFDNLIDI